MLQRFASTAFVAGTLLTALMPAVGLARDRGGNSAGGRNSSSGRSTQSNSNRRQSFPGGNRNYAPRGGEIRSSGRQSFVSPRGNDGRHAYSNGPSYYSRGYVAPRSYGRSVYGGHYSRGYYSGGVYLGYAAPYGYYDDPGYGYVPGNAYDPASSYGPVPAPQTCAQGSYDQYGAWVPDPNCYSDQQQYPLQQQNYDPAPQQYSQPQQNYDPNRQPYSQPQNYEPNQPQPYSR